MSNSSLTVAQLIIKGGPLMWPILVCSITALSVSIERFYYLSQLSKNMEEFQRKVLECIQDNRIKKAVVVCDQAQFPIAAIVKAGLMKFGSNKMEVKEAMQAVSQFEIPRLEKRLRLLATLAHVALFCGLLGTVIGMAQVFYMIEIRSAAMNPTTPADLAGGVWQALLTTIFGLCVAMSSFLVYNFFVHWVNQLVMRMEGFSLECVNSITHVSRIQSSPGEDL